MLIYSIDKPDVRCTPYLITHALFEQIDLTKQLSSIILSLDQWKGITRKQAEPVEMVCNLLAYSVR